MNNYENGFTIINNSTIINTSISDGAYRLYSYLTSICYNKDFCFPSQVTISKMVGKSVRQVQRLLKELINANLISQKRRGSISNIYYILAKKGQNLHSKAREIIANIKQGASQKEGSTGKSKQYNGNKNSNWNYEGQRTYSDDFLKNIENIHQGRT